MQSEKGNFDNEIVININKENFDKKTNQFSLGKGDNTKFSISPEEFNDNIYFFFLNPKSGNQQGKLMLNYSSKKFKYLDIRSIVLLYDITDNNSFLEGISNLKYYHLNSQNEKMPRIIIGGGDGTTSSTINRIAKENVEIERCIFGVLPLGTGNDFANSLGWSPVVDIDEKEGKLKPLIVEFNQAYLSPVDIWGLKLSLDKGNGRVVTVFKTESGFKKSDLQEHGERITVFKRLFVNYFSVGFDSRVGFGFEKRRTSQRCCNKLIYFCEGFKKIFCRKSICVKDYLESFNQIDPNGNLKEIFGNSLVPKKNKKPDLSFLHKDIKNIETSCQLKGDPVTFFCQNINKFMDGTENVWKKSGNRVGLEYLNEQNQVIEADFSELIQSKQSHNDGMLEFITYESGLHLACEKLIKGNARKVFQGKGPFLIKFKDIQNNNQNDRAARIYFSFDGEYYQIVNPLELKISPKKKFPHGKIFFLHRKNTYPK